MVQCRVFGKRSSNSKFCPEIKETPKRYSSSNTDEGISSCTLPPAIYRSQSHNARAHGRACLPVSLSQLCSRMNTANLPRAHSSSSFLALSMARGINWVDNAAGERTQGEGGREGGRAHEPISNSFLGAKTLSSPLSVVRSTAPHPRPASPSSGFMGGCFRWRRSISNLHRFYFNEQHFLHREQIERDKASSQASHRTDGGRGHYTNTLASKNCVASVVSFICLVSPF